MRRDDFEARAEPQMERVAEDNLRAELDELIGCHSFDRAISSHRHESRCFDDAMGKRKPTASRRATLRGNGKFHRRDCSSAPRGASRTYAPAAESRSSSIASP